MIVKKHSFRSITYEKKNVVVYTSLVSLRREDREIPNKTAH